MIEVAVERSPRGRLLRSHARHSQPEPPTFAPPPPVQSALIAGKWKALSEEERAKWNADTKAAKDKYEAIHGKTVRKPKKDAKGDADVKKKKKKDGPKKAKSAYIYFSVEKGAAIRKENASATMKDTSKLIGDMWKVLSAEDKKPYEALAAADKERYASAVKVGAQGKAGAGAGAADEDESDSSEVSPLPRTP